MVRPLSARHFGIGAHGCALRQHGGKQRRECLRSGSLDGAACGYSRYEGNLDATQLETALWQSESESENESEGEGAPYLLIGIRGRRTCDAVVPRFVSTL